MANECKEKFERRKEKLVQSQVNSNIHLKIVKTVNSLIPKSDQHLISPYNITPESHIKVMRIKEMTTNWRSCWLLEKFFSSAPQEMYREQYGEYECWYLGLKGLKHLSNFLSNTAITYSW